jgi:serine/threonine protein kinase
MAQRDARLIGGVYRLGAVMTTGKMLTTYTAHNRYTNDMVGLSVLEFPPSFPIHEAQQALQPLNRRRALQSSSVISIHDWGLDGNRAYIATDPPRGMTLRYVMDNEPIDIPRALDLVQQVAQGLEVLHEHGIIGNDLRPQLITVDASRVADHVQLDDIGLRAILHSLGYSSQSPDDIGYLDPRYTSPEIIQGKPAGPASDLYQVGLLLFELLTGRLPFVGRTSAETGVLQCTSPVPQMNQFTHNATEELQSIVNKALAKEPGERYESARALLAVLKAVPTKPASSSLTNVIPTIEDDETISAIPLSASSHTQIGSVALPELPNAQGIYANLCYERSKGDMQQLRILKEEVIIGRADPKHDYLPDIDLTIFDPKATVSRRHARISFRDRLFYIEDLKSSNHTRLGSLILTPNQPVLLQHGDRIRFGRVSLEFRIPGMSKLPMPNKES